VRPAFGDELASKWELRDLETKVADRRDPWRPRNRQLRTSSELRLFRTTREGVPLIVELR